MAVLADSQAKNEAQKINTLIEQLQHTQDDANQLTDHDLRSWVIYCIENALKALREEY